MYKLNNCDLIEEQRKKDGGMIWRQLRGLCLQMTGLAWVKDKIECIAGNSWPRLSWLVIGIKAKPIDIWTSLIFSISLYFTATFSFSFLSLSPSLLSSTLFILLRTAVPFLQIEKRRKERKEKFSFFLYSFMAVFSF